MTNDTRDEFVRSVTMEVVRRLSAMEGEAASAVEKRDTILLLGNAPGVCIEGGWNVECEADYGRHGEIRCYKAVHISDMTAAQLSDIAHGRDATMFSCAVIHALLAEIPVRMEADAQGWKKFACDMSSPMARMLAGYEKRLSVLGVETIGKTREDGIEVRLRNCNAAKTKKTVITAETAKSMCAKGDEVYIGRGDVVTPLARDVFAAAGARIVHVDGKGDAAC